MSTDLIVPYTKRKILIEGQSSGRVVYSPYLQTFLSHGHKHLGFLFPSIVDSGADRCIFPLNFAEAINLNIEQTERRISRGIGGGDVIYFHKVTVRVVIQEQAWQFHCEAGFAASLDEIGVGFLGRRGFFELFEEIIFNEHKREFRLKLLKKEE